MYLYQLLAEIAEDTRYSPRWRQTQHRELTAKCELYLAMNPFRRSDGTIIEPEHTLRTYAPSQERLGTPGDL